MLSSLAHKIKKDKLTVGLIAGVVLIIILGFVGYNRFLASQTPKVLEEIDLNFDPEGPYALLLPRRDGNAINLNIKRVSSYGGITYELTYQSEGIDRGVQGTIDTGSKSNEYNQEILFGTCSKGDTFSTRHCVFDKGVENGTLVLKIQEGDKIYKMTTPWHFQRIDVALGKLTSGDGHFTYTTDASQQDLAVVGYSLINDLSGVPILPKGKEVLGKVYGLNVPLAKVLPDGEVSIELAKDAPIGATIARYVEGENSWEMLDTKASGSTLSAPAPGAGIFAILVDSKE